MSTFVEREIAKTEAAADNLLKTGLEAQSKTASNGSKAGAVKLPASSGAKPGQPFPKFPIEVFPTPLRKYAEEVAASLPCPIDFPGAYMIPALGAAIGTSCVLEVKPGWRERSCIYEAVVAEPGELKTPAFDAILLPFRKRQKKLQNEYEIALQVYKEALKAAKQGGEQPDEVPVMEQVFTTDATLEAFGEKLHENPRGLLFPQDELTAWVASLNQYKGGHGSDRQKWLSFWSGSGELINRKGKAAIYLHNPFACVVGGIQPDFLSQLYNETLEDGFIHRLLFSFPEALPIQAFSDACINSTTEMQYLQVFDKLWELEPVLDGQGNSTPKILHFTEEGKSAFVELHDQHLSEMSEPLFPVNLRGPWAKLKGYAIRLALILHLARVACGETKSEDVDKTSVIGAFVLLEYFKAHARKVYSRLQSSPEELQSERLLRWIEKQSSKTITSRQVQMHHVAGVKSADEARTLLKILAQEGHGALTSEGAFTLAQRNTQQGTKI